MKKKIELTEAKKVKTLEYLEELKKLTEAARQYGERRIQAKEKLEKLKEALIELESEFAFELDDKNRDKIYKKKVEVLQEIQQAEITVTTDVHELLRKKFNELKKTKLGIEAYDEAQSFSKEIDEAIDSLEKETKKKIQELEQIKASHPSHKVFKLESNISNILRGSLPLERLIK